MKNLFDTLAYIGGVLFSAMLISGILIVVIITLQEMWGARYEDEDAERDRLYEWEDLE